MTLKRISGFTIIELMMVLIIVAVLMALAYPSYVDHVRKAKRGEAQQLLMTWSVNQEIFRSSNPQYATTDQMAAPVHNDYTFSLPTRSATAFVLQAAAKSGNDQLNDDEDGTACSTLNLNSSGQKYSGGDTSKTVCWN